VARCGHFLQFAALLDVTDHGLTTFLDFNSFNANDLRSAAPQPAQLRSGALGMTITLLR